MSVRLDLAQIVGDAKLRDNMLSILRGGITTLTVAATPVETSIMVAAQLAFTEPDMDKAYEFTVGVVDSAKVPLASIKGEAFPTRPEGADEVFPFVFTIIERLDFVAPIVGYYAAVVVLNGKPMRYLPFKVVTQGA